MRLLLDTHILIWSVHNSTRLSSEALSLIVDLDNELIFSAASLWKIAIKTGLARDTFKFDVKILRDGLLAKTTPNWTCLVHMPMR